jgi:hypothetical protein
MVMMIIKKYGGLLSKDGSSDASASQLCDAAAADDLHTLQLLKEAGVNLNLKDYDSRYALHLAANKGRLRAISYLVSICADPNVKDRWGSTPVEDALRNGHVHCARLLAAFGGAPGPRSTPDVVGQYQEILHSVSMEDVREQLKLSIDKVRSARSFPVSFIPADFTLFSLTLEHCVVALLQAVGKPTSEVNDNDILAQRRATFSAVQLIAKARDLWEDIKERQTTAIERIGSVTDAVWEHTKVLAAETANPARKVTTPTPLVCPWTSLRRQPAGLLSRLLIPRQSPALDNSKWQAQYQELHRAMGKSMGR